jgi:hypothetical protein
MSKGRKVLQTVGVDASGHRSAAQWRGTATRRLRLGARARFAMVSTAVIIAAGDVAHPRAGTRPLSVDTIGGARGLAAASNAQGTMYQRNGAHFAVMFEGPADEAVAFRAVELLEAAYYRIGSALNVYPTEPVTVVLYTREQFRNVTRLPEWVAGAYDGRIHVPIKGADTLPQQLDEVLAHEFAHALVASLGGRQVPTWLNEGLASVMEPGGARTEIEALARVPTRLPLAALQRGFAQLPVDDIPLAYAQSALAVRKLIDLRGASAVVSLLRAVGNGGAFEAAFQQSAGMRLEDFESLVVR